MPCQAIELTSASARRMAARLVKPSGADNASLSLAALYLEVLAASLERVEIEAAGQLSFLETAFQAELLPPGPSVARDVGSRSALGAGSQGQ